jgi:hypothetical protein
MELGLRLKADVITFAFVRNLLSTIYQAVVALICMLFVSAACVTNFYLVLAPWEVGSTCRGCIPAYVRKSWQRPLVGSLDWDLDLYTASARER